MHQLLTNETKNNLKNQENYATLIKRESHLKRQKCFRKRFKSLDQPQ